MSGRDDRRVHAVGMGMEVVRYDRAGKWYLEPLDPALRRKNVGVLDAANYAGWLLRNGGTVNFGLPGGSMFDRAVQGR